MGIQARELRHPVAVFGIGSLLRSFNRLRFGLGVNEGGQEGGGLGRFAQGLRESPGGAGGVAVVVEVEMAHRSAGEAGEGINGAGGQGAGAAALVSATGVSASGAALAHTQWAQSNSAWASTVFTASSCRSGG